MDFNIEDYEEEKNFILNNPATPTLKLMRDFAKQYHKKQLTLTTRLLTELRKHYLVEIDFDSGLPKADLKTVMKLWDEVNKKLNIKTVGS